MGKITYNGKEMSEAQVIRVGDTKKLTRITTSAGKVLNLPVTYDAPKDGSLVQDAKIRLWNNFTENTNRNGAAQYMFTSEGYGFETLARNLAGNAAYSAQWETPLIIRDYAKYDKIEISFTMMSAFATEQHDTANVAASAGAYRGMANDTKKDNLDFNTSGENFDTRLDNMLITVSDIGKSTQKVTIANKNHSKTVTSLYSNTGFSVSYNGEETQHILFGTGGTGSNSLWHNTPNVTEDFGHIYRDLALEADLVIASIPVYQPGSGRLGSHAAVQDMKVKLYLK